MIYVNQKQLDQVEYIIEQSTRGFHVLFDNTVIRKAFKNAKEKKLEAEDDSEEGAIEKHIENVILEPTLLAKKTYLENLPPKVFNRVVQTYFSIVENNIFESMEYEQ